MISKSKVIDKYLEMVDSLAYILSNMDDEIQLEGGYFCYIMG